MITSFMIGFFVTSIVLTAVVWDDSGILLSKIFILNMYRSDFQRFFVNSFGHLRLDFDSNTFVRQYFAHHWNQKTRLYQANAIYDIYGRLYTYWFSSNIYKRTPRIAFCNRICSSRHIFLHLHLFTLQQVEGREIRARYFINVCSTTTNGNH